MEYRFVTDKKNYEDFSSGRVIYNQLGTTSFPVRLTSEIFQRCREYLEAKGRKGPYTIYDPCCGGGYLLTVIGFLHGDDLSCIFASDLNAKLVDLAEKNLSLLTPAGLDERIHQIEAMFASYSKASHKEALESASRLKKMVKNRKSSIRIECFQADALNLEECIKKPLCIDILITDVPYGNLVKWSDDNANAMKTFLDEMSKLIKPASILAVIADKAQAIKHDKFRRLKHIKIGKRQVVFLELITYTPVQQKI